MPCVARQVPQFPLGLSLRWRAEPVVAGRRPTSGLGHKHRHVCADSHAVLPLLPPAQSRKDVEGAMHVVKRRGQPRFRYIVLNRKGSSEFWKGGARGSSMPHGMHSRGCLYSLVEDRICMAGPSQRAEGPATPRSRAWVEGLNPPARGSSLCCRGFCGGHRQRLHLRTPATVPAVPHQLGQGRRGGVCETGRESRRRPAWRWGPV